ncbi:hypothetical protein GWL_45160 [Herbaspirillum sp. GW103]|nr:hypothetical protein GWL_45160 [Herbaspirillum sp. GW103]
MASRRLMPCGTPKALACAHMIGFAKEKKYASSGPPSGAVQGLPHFAAL